MSSHQANSLVAFVTGLTGGQLEQLFVQPYCVVAILRSLQPLSRHVLLRFTATSGSISAALVSSWARAEGDSKLGAALAELQKLHLLAQVAQGGQAAWAVNASFQAQLRHAICSGLLTEQDSGALPPAAALPSAAELNAYARQQWDGLLLYLVGGSSQPPGPPPELRGAAPVDIPSLLARAGLMLKDEYTLTQSISQSGFQFLLADLYSQLWSAVRQYLADLQAAAGEAGGAGTAGADLAVAVNFLLRLGLQAGRPMCYSRLAESERVIAAHMAHLGLLMPLPAGGEVWLHPTRMAAVLAGGGRAGEAAAAAEDGFVIVESNFRVYAYTTSAVQAAILRVFVRCDALLPNLFVGTITRDSAVAALEAGITADQIVGFLRQHAHPRVAAKTPIVPAVVADQVRLWQQELRRLRSNAATLYGRFEGPALYASAAEHAQRLGALLYRDDERQVLAVQSAFHDAMRVHIKTQKAALGL
ncbi:general transcription factor IIH subunit 4 isoform B [Chlorella sorokiniana]|uniref:RNA polymerase II transcription factor B subunit 2 n=1 Tax=Chlorella sorokiniana TaxID=3076 RepID=A0A2P6U0C9_CHLSO|nr:general transcription factor IIH subunit 4 isoform A [Chlorella sorokiniana]PRW59757.1 general transcription factor IIH subunit 4 isoform B [Chlorella sorokiniana]|eukprot:PRW59756.1 general transcription factor IIH subunit 4 isoform A [Chlorella sorokiniana]